MNKKKQTDYRVILGVVAGITLIEIVALMNGINGKLMTLIIGILAALGGLSAPQLKLK